MELTPYLNFDGRCEEAFKLYETCLGGKITFMMKFADMPGADVPPGWGDKIAHITLMADGATLQGSDAGPEHYEKPQGTTVSISLPDPAEAERIFAGLAEGAKIGMPLQETFWALRFGTLTDRFGTPWMINCEKSAAE